MRAAVFDVDEQFYFKPDAARLLISPADEEPHPPGDVYADDLMVAIGIERIEAALDLEVRRVGHSWAGLRTFAPDRNPVIGIDSRVPGLRVRRPAAGRRVSGREQRHGPPAWLVCHGAGRRVSVRRGRPATHYLPTVEPGRLLPDGYEHMPNASRLARHLNGSVSWMDRQLMRLPPLRAAAMIMVARLWPRT